jgi:hypothetical protein
LKLNFFMKRRVFFSDESGWRTLSDTDTDKIELSKRLWVLTTEPTSELTLEPTPDPKPAPDPEPDPAPDPAPGNEPTLYTEPTPDPGPAPDSGLTPEPGPTLIAYVNNPFTDAGGYINRFIPQSCIKKMAKW